MFHLVLNTRFICNATPIDWFLFDTNFYRKGFSKQAIEIWILIPIIPRNVFKLHTKKIYTKYGEICVFEKSPHENCHGEKKSWAEWSRISLLFSKSIPWLDQLYIGSFFNLYMTLLDITKMRNWWNSKFSKLSQVVHK